MVSQSVPPLIEKRAMADAQVYTDQDTDDDLEACFEGNPFKTVPGHFKLFYRCMRSKPGEEPTEPFYYLELDPPRREVQLE